MGGPRLRNMSSSCNNDRHSGAKLLNATDPPIEEKKTKNDMRESSITLQAVEIDAASALSPMSSTLASMSTLQNITLDSAVSRPAIHDALLPGSSVGPSAGNRNIYYMHPEQTLSCHLNKAYNGDDAERGSNVVHAMNCKQQPPLSQSIQYNQPVLRRGKWTAEEEAYANAVVREFNSGYLDAPAGTTLRIYLSEKLQCDPMRITKKFTGNDSIGKRVFHPTGRSGDGLTKEAKDAQVSCTILYSYLQIECSTHREPSAS